MKSVMRPSLIALALAGTALLGWAHTAAAAELMACAAKEKEAVGPNDKLLCESVQGVKSETTLGALYGDGWHMVQTAFYNGNRQVIYLEK